jgi:hypothetical protein
MTETIREAALKRDSAKFYPFLPARMWTAAARIAELVAIYRGLTARVTDRAHRVLSEAHFMFRSRELQTSAGK